MPTRFSYEELKQATEEFLRKLGEGGFGAVFEGTLVSGEKAAAKRLDALGQGKKEFLAEVKTIGSIHHINLVRLVGFCAENLRRLLVDQSRVVTTMRGTPGYLAPELFISIVTEKADVYSFGIKVMEVVCGRKNLDLLHSEGCIHLLPFFMIKAEEDCLIDLVDKDSEDMQLHGEEVVQMMRVAVWCLQNDYNMRPSMSTMVKVLEGSMEFEVSLTAITREAEEQFGVTMSELLPSILLGPRRPSCGQLFYLNGFPVGHKLHGKNMKPRNKHAKSTAAVHNAQTATAERSTFTTEEYNQIMKMLREGNGNIQFLANAIGMITPTCNTI
ncbi:hypothetical protein LWI28_021809 [Acer negundo]|uniref:Protein kinase domain-containing protein n=1 Tax=Acer negundo TaxID=4023 RepID=A0AAD5JR15_ACENE|nr:hypothetical protein LWI28_021809 [Acer negundo]